MTRISVAEARDRLADLNNRVAYGSERVVLERRGKGVAALVSLEDLEVLEKLEDQLDVEAAREAKSEMERTGEKPVPCEQVKAELGL